MLFADIDDPLQTMESIISKLTDKHDPDFGGINTWSGLIEKVNELSQRGQRQSNEIQVSSWRKFKRIINKSIKNDPMFGQRPIESLNECRLADELKRYMRMTYA